MVFGFSRKERRVPDLSRYDYYYENQPDYNKSHRLSAAAASAAAGGGVSRSQSMVYSSNPVSYSHPTQSPPSNSRNSTMGSRMRKSSSQYITPNGNSNYKTYSLRSESSYGNINDRLHSNMAPKTRISSSPTTASAQRKTRVKKTVTSTPAPTSRRASTRISTNNTTATTTTTAVKTTKKANNNNNNNSNNIPSRSISNPNPPKTQKRLNSLTSNRPSHSITTATGNTSRLNSITSTGTSRRLKKTSSNNNGPSSRTNSITTKVTRVTDPQGRTKSITKKTIKRIDGYEYIETTTTTTNLVPLDERENEPTLDPQSQRHFDEFSDNFNMTEDEDLESLLLGSPNKEIYQDNMYDNEVIDNHIDDTLNNGHLQEIDDTLSVPNEIEEERDINLNEEDEYINQDEPESNQLLDDVVEEEEEELQEEKPIVSEGEELLEDEEEDDDDHENTLNMIDQIEMRDSVNSPQLDEQQDNLPLSPPQNSISYAAGLIPLDEASSVSKFSDARESAPSSSENLLQQPQQKSSQKSNPQIYEHQFVSDPEREQDYDYESDHEYQYQPEETQPAVVNRQPKAAKAPVVKKQLKKKVTIEQKSLANENTRPNKSIKRHAKSVIQSPPQPKKPLSEQEMYLMALEVAKKKVYSNGYNTGRNDYVSPKDARSTMGSRMTLRDQTVPKESMVSPQNSMIHHDNTKHNSSHHMGLNMMHNEKSSSPQKHNSKSFGSSFFSKHKHESAKPVISLPIPVSQSVLPVTDPVGEQTSIVSSQLSQPTKPRASKEIAPTLSSTRSEQETKLADEQMYAKALEIAQKRFNDVQQKSLQQQQHENLIAAKEREETIRNKLENSIEQYNTTSSGPLDKPPPAIAINDTSVNQSPNVNSVATFDSNQSAKPTPNQPSMMKFEEMPATYETAQKDIITEQPSTTVPDSHDRDAREQTPENDSQSGALLTATPEGHFEPSNVMKMPTLESSTSPKKKNMFSRRPSVGVEKNKSKFKNMFDKVVQFSNENSGYRPTKKEKAKMEEEKKLANQMEIENEQNIYEQQIHPPPLERGPSLSHGAATTLPVQQSLNHFPQGLNPAPSVSSFQRRRSGAGQGTSNDNVTNTSSIFSNSKKQTDISITPPDEIGHQQVQQKLTATERVQVNVPDIVTTTADSRQQIEKINSHSSSKSKSKFFSKIFKRSKQTS
ncbi:hypothetical protein MOSE0_N06392 [Monosporozyma servazzii]